MTRAERAGRAKLFIVREFTEKQQVFLDFVLGHYVGVGVGELDQEKLTPLLRLKYGGPWEAVAELGKPEEIRQVFVGFQKYLYESAAGTRDRNGGSWYRPPGTSQNPRTGVSAPNQNSLSDYSALLSSRSRSQVKITGVTIKT